MKESLTREDIEFCVKVIATTAIENEKYLSELDAAAGDADFGVSLATGFRAVLQEWELLDRSSISSFLTKVGMIITGNVGGCSGPIWGTAFMRGAASAKGKVALRAADLAEMMENAIEGIRARGNASLGDKTLLDALYPAATKLREFAKEGSQNLLDGLQEAASAASASKEATRGLEAKRGRQSFTGKRSIGTLDPGIVAVAIMLENIVKGLRKVYETQ